MTVRVETFLFQAEALIGKLYFQSSALSAPRWSTPAHVLDFRTAHGGLEFEESDVKDGHFEDVPMGFAHKENKKSAHKS